MLTYSLLLEILQEFPNPSSGKAIYHVIQTQNHQENLQGKKISPAELKLSEICQPLTCSKQQALFHARVGKKVLNKA